MEHTMKTATFTFALVVLTLGSLAEAQEASGTGRPDPTGRGRYLQFGAEVPYPGATVLKDLPAGVKCAPAGELVGVPLWNTTRANRAIVSRLTEKAEIAVIDNRTFLCWCADGFNQLFVPEKPRGNNVVPTPPTPPTSETFVVERREGGNVTVNVTNTNTNTLRAAAEREAQGSLRRRSDAFFPKENESRWYKSPVLWGLIGAGVGAGSVAYYYWCP